MHDFNSHSRAGTMLRINTGNAAAIVAYRQAKHSAAGAQRNDNMMSTAMPYRIVGGFLRNPIKVERNVGYC